MAFSFEKFFEGPEFFLLAGFLTIICIQHFIYLRSLQQKDILEQEKWSEVSHDIRSPVQFLNFYLGEQKNTDPSLQKLALEAVNRVQTIVDESSAKKRLLRSKRGQTSFGLSRRFLRLELSKGGGE